MLEKLMPEPVSEYELEEIVDDAIAETGATTLRGARSGDGRRDAAGRRPRQRLRVSQLVREKLAERFASPGGRCGCSWGARCLQQMRCGGAAEPRLGRMSEIPA